MPSPALSLIPVIPRERGPATALGSQGTGPWKGPLGIWDLSGALASQHLISQHCPPESPQHCRTGQTCVYLVLR